MKLYQIIVKSFLLVVYLCSLGISSYLLLWSFRRLRTKDKFIFLESLFLFLCCVSRVLYLVESLVLAFLPCGTVSYWLSLVDEVMLSVSVLFFFPTLYANLALWLNFLVGSYYISRYAFRDYQ